MYCTKPKCCISTTDCAHSSKVQGTVVFFEILMRLPDLLRVKYLKGVICISVCGCKFFHCLSKQSLVTLFNNYHWTGVYNFFIISSIQFNLLWIFLKILSNNINCEKLDMYCVFLSAKDFQQKQLLLPSFEWENKIQENRLSCAILSLLNSCTLNPEWQILTALMLF